MKKIGIAFFCFQNIGQVHSYFRMRKKISHVKFTSREDIVVYYLFSHFHHSRETDCGGGRTTEQGSKLSAPFYPPMIDNRRQTEILTD